MVNILKWLVFPAQTAQFLAGHMLTRFLYKYRHSCIIGCLPDFMSVIDAVVVDGDRTLWKGYAIEALGKAYLVKAVRELNLYKAANYAFGIANAGLIINAYRDSDGIPNGQKKFYDVMIENDMGMKEEMNSIVGKHIRNNVIEKVAKIVDYYVTWNIPVLLSTMAGSTTADYAKYNFRLTDTVSNVEIFDNSKKLIGFDAKITCGESKLALTEEVLDRHGLKLWNCMVIGDSVYDMPMLQSAKISMASPFASEKVLELKRIVRLEKE